MTTQLNFAKDVNGFNTFGINTSDHKVSTTLSAGVEQVTTVPSDAPKYLAVIASGQGHNVFVAINSTATVSGVSFASTDSDLNPPALIVQAGDILHFITPDTTAYLNVKYYADIT